ncbi:mechanosensitive ion channel domain-containing protein [Ferrimonas balearica]|uniref:mechanosensitive ion channel domain-containing protein n=1 Tax=Ferrimonas balearica TaxID=44012 RepID=UPI001C99D9EA|nr:mechanosensitive ion channel domain-containing protein [Ferrimonas balearica]MBY5992285.1 mechanosensitive ion channel [Ferrimonas balearica]
MRRHLLLLLALLFTLSAQASSPFSLERRLAPFGNQEPTQTTAQQWAEQRRQLENQLSQHQELIEEFPVLQAQLQSQLNHALPTAVDDDQPVTQQISLVHLELQELKSSAAALAQMRAQSRKRIADLPQIEQQAAAQLKLALSAGKDPLARARQAYFQQLVQTLQAEQKALPLQLQLVQLRERLVHNQQGDLEQRLANLNDAASAQRQAQSRTALTTTLPQASADPSLSKLSEENAELARALARVNGRLERLGRQVVDIEQQYQTQSTHLVETEEQLQWGVVSAAFGESLIRRLNQLERQSFDTDTGRQLSQSRLSRYDYEQQREQLMRQLRRADNNEPRRDLWERQAQLLEQIIAAHEELVLELTRYKLQQDQLELQSDRFRRLITEHLFWLPNSRPLDRNWSKELGLSLAWLFDTQRLKELADAVAQNRTWWSLYLVLLVLVVVLSDLLKGPYARARARQARHIGNVTQDRFSASFFALLTAATYSLLAPLPLWAAGGLLSMSTGHLFAQALGKALLFTALLVQIYWVIHQLAREDGLLIAHFRRHPPLVAHMRRFLRKCLMVVSPMVLLVVLTEALDLEMIRASLGRGAFLLLCLALAYFYRRMARFASQYHKHHSRNRTNRRLLERLIWLVLILVPLVALGLAAQGYYYSAMQVLSQAQLTVLLAILYLLAYLMVKRWTLIERRRLQFERAKARRADLLAQREREKEEAVPANSAEGQLESIEEPQIDLDTISTQSLGLMRSLMILAFLLSLIALWSQTHSAMFSFLEGITLWSSTQMLDGVEQDLPITLMSFATAALVAVFTGMIARNLPGLLELVLLQRLELSPGTGFAITTVTKYLVYMVGVFITFSLLGLAWNKMQWLIAALTVGLGFGLQEIFANFISGLIILFEKPIRIGDTVTIRELTGTVSKIQIRATTIVDWDRKEIIVPNKAFITEQLVNWSLSDPITRVSMRVAVARDSDPVLVEALLHQAVKECSLALEQPEPEIYFGGFGSHTQDFELRAYADEMGKRWPLRHDLHMRIIAKFREAGVVLAYPQMDLHIKSGDTKESGLIR